jgi:M6 family metalloprotease-like protein
MKKINIIILSIIFYFTMLNSNSAQVSIPRASYKIQGNGIPARPGEITYNQPDGTVIHVFLKGDRAISWAESDDGYTLLSNPNGFYEYAKTDINGNMITSGIVAHDPDKRTNIELSFLTSIQKGILYSNNQLTQKCATYKLMAQSNSKSFPSSGTRNNLVLMVQFSDLSFSYSLSNFDNLMNQPNYNGIGSFRDYYYQNSNGLLTVNTLVDGIYTAPNTHDYYGQDNGSNKDINVEELVTSLIYGADPYINFSQYDNDGDGIVDCLYIIYAGHSQAESGNPNDIWPHNNPGFTPITVDGVTINSYTISNEIKGTGTSMAGIGTICHEFGHALGLPDFYDTDYTGSGGQGEGTGEWDVMGAGNYNGDGDSPANHNPLSKYILGWQNFGLLTSNGSYLLPPTEIDTLTAWLPSTGSNEGFILENRQQIGFDNGLPGHGMLIYHLDEK